MATEPSKKGKTGGYALAKPAHDIRIGDIIRQGNHATTGSPGVAPALRGERMSTGLINSDMQPSRHTDRLLVAFAKIV